MTTALGESYATQLLAVIQAQDRPDKAALLARLAPPVPEARWEMPQLPARPGRPSGWRERTVAPKRRRTLTHAPTRNRFLLSIHHIEMSAIDLAVVACLRGSGMPSAFHHDFLGIARDEARHAGLLEELLAARTVFPGDEPVHFRLWQTALACTDLGEHLVAVPRVLEARGLDVSAQLLPRLAGIDAPAHAVLSVIYRDEIGHVAIGTTWQRYWCDQARRDSFEHFAGVVAALFPGQHPGPTALDRPGRHQAGFNNRELDLLSGCEQVGQGDTRSV
jgi:uncharacterized ferritin-like protein (DUF455 family)